MNPSADWLNPLAELPELDIDPPKQCPEPQCRCFLKREWQVELDWREDERGHQYQVVVYYNICPRCRNIVKKVV